MGQMREEVIPKFLPGKAKGETMSLNQRVNQVSSLQWSIEVVDKLLTPFDFLGQQDPYRFVG